MKKVWNCEKDTIIFVKTTDMASKSNMNESDAQIAQLLANGYTVPEISKKLKVKKRTLEGRIIVAKEKALAETLPQFVANYLRKGLIK